MPVHFVHWLGSIVVAGVIILSSSAGNAADYSSLLNSINLPDGFKISIFAEVTKARSLTVGPALDTVIVGTRQGSFHSLRDTNQNGIADQVRIRGRNLNVPNGVAIKDGILYVAEQDKISSSSVLVELDTARRISLTPIKDGLPDKSHHGWRYLKFGPDGKLYVSIGAPYNIGMPEGLEGTIARMDPNGENFEIFAKGVRNSVGFDFHPITGDMFFTDNGADGMGDDIPPDEFNHVTKPGQHFGYPHLGGISIKLPANRNGNRDKRIGAPPAQMVAPVIEFQAHTANLGVHFYRGGQFPDEYNNDAFVAQHGSWNRSSRVGYRIMRIRFNADGEAIGKEVFADGWLRNGRVSGRPVDITQLADGSLLVSDDYANVVYRISYGE